MGWEGLLASLPPERRRAMEFLREHLPESDLDGYPAELFLQFAEHAMGLREAVPWCGALDWEIFAHYVLFPRVNDEDLSFHRALFYDALWSRVKDLPTMEDRVLEVNRWCHEHASYQAQDERTASPLTVWRCGSGRCGEESAFLVSALRSVGIPARQVYCPRWSHCDDNHAWVEVLCGNSWRFLGACEPEPVLDRGWFLTAASRAMLVHSRIFGEGASPLHGERLGREGEVTWFNQTARYAPVTVYTFQALADGKPAAGAVFQLQILNEASFHTIAVLTADSQGIARAALGRGSLHVAAALGGLTAVGDCGEGGIVLQLARRETSGGDWRDFDFLAPADRGTPPSLLDEAQKAQRAQVRSRGDALRQRRLAEFLPPEEAPCRDLLLAARGNWREIHAFLSGSCPEQRERLVRTLSDKDLRDASQDVLEEHWRHLPPRAEGVPEEVYWQYTACPRIALERLTPWRGALKKVLADWQGTPQALLWHLEERLERREDGYGGLCWPPEAAWRAGGCDQRSLRLLLIAALRTLGVPARLRPLDGAPEYWDGDDFRPVLPEEAGILRLICPEGREPRYRQDWTLSRWGEDRWRLLMPEGRWEGGELRIALPVGRYRLMTSTRLPGGNQFATKRELHLEAGREESVALRLRTCRLEDLLSAQALPALSARTLEGGTVPDLFRLDGRPILAFWLEEGGEPTEHVLNELMENRQALEALPVHILFLLRSPESLEQPTLVRVLARWKGVRVLLDDWAYDLETITRHLGRDPDSPPLAVACDGAGQAVYSVSGYRVGSVALLARIAAHLLGGSEDRGDSLTGS